MLRDTLNHWRVSRGLRRKPALSESGMTLLELIIACAILFLWAIFVIIYLSRRRKS